MHPDPFLKDMESHLGFKYSEIVADAGYESEENYLFIEGNGQTAYIKPQNYENFENPKIQKRHQQKRKHGVSRRQRQLYLSEWKGTDSYK